MTTGSLLLGFALAVAVALYIARPFLDVNGRHRSRLSARQSLIIQKEATLVQISELDFDYETGKMDEEAYRQQRAKFMAQATAILKELDRVDEKSPVVAGPDGRQERPAVVQTDIEAAIARRRNKTAAGKPAAGKSAPTTRPAEKPAPGKPPGKQPSEPGVEAEFANGKAGFCPQCGQSADSTDKFCSHCGTMLSQPQHV